MKFIEPSVEIIKQEPGLDGLYKHIEKCGRTAYKSEDHITDDSAKKFVDMLTNRGHGAALEHGTCYLRIPIEDWNEIIDDHDLEFFDCPYQWFGYDYTTGIDGQEYIWITTNYRVLVEHGYTELLDFLYTPTEEEFKETTASQHFMRRITVKFTCDRGVSHEFVRHRQFSFIMESTRYCNYNKAKFGSQITYIIPQWIHDIQKNIAATIDPLTGETRKQWLDYKDDILMNMLTVEDRTVAQYMDTLQKIEDCYLDMITLDDGTKLVPQQARQILPNALKTELVMTGTIEQWEGFFKLRCDVAAHPDARYLANKLHEMFLNEGFINN